MAAQWMFRLYWLGWFLCHPSALDEAVRRYVEGDVPVTVDASTPCTCVLEGDDGSIHSAHVYSAAQRPAAIYRHGHLYTYKHQEGGRFIYVQG